MLGWLHLESGMRKEGSSGGGGCFHSLAWLPEEGKFGNGCIRGDLHNSIILYLKEGQLNFVDRFECSWLFTNSHHEFLELF